MSRSETRSVLGTPEVFRRAAYSLTPSDSYFEEGVILGFGLDERLRAVDLTSRADAAFRGIRLLRRRADDVLADLVAADVVVETTRWGWYARQLGMEFGDRDADGAFTHIGISAGDRVASEPSFFPGTDAAVRIDHDFRIVGHRGFSGGVELGADRGCLRSILGPGFATTPEFGGVALDKFLETGMVVLYDSAETAVRLVAIQPARPIFEGVALLGRSWAEVQRDALARGVGVVAREAEFWFPGGGFRVWPARVAPGEGLPLVGVSFP
jgi:hypothetical protein